MEWVGEVTQYVRAGGHDDVHRSELGDALDQLDLATQAQDGQVHQGGETDLAEQDDTFRRVSDLGVNVDCVSRRKGLLQLVVGDENVFVHQRLTQGFSADLTANRLDHLCTSLLGSDVVMRSPCW